MADEFIDVNGSLVYPPGFWETWTSAKRQQWFSERTRLSPGEFAWYSAKLDKLWRVSQFARDYERGDH